MSSTKWANSAEIEALASLYELAKMNKRRIDTGVAENFRISLSGTADLALALTATMSRVKREEARSLINRVFGLDITPATLRTVLKGFIAALAQRGREVDVDKLEEPERAWLRGVVWSSPLIQALVKKNAVEAPKRAQSNSLPMRQASALQILRMQRSLKEAAAIACNEDLAVLIDACEFGPEDMSFDDAAAAQIGRRLAARMDGLLRMVELKHPHVPIREGMAMDQHLKQWLKKNAPYARGMPARIQQINLMFVLDRSGLVGVDPRCGGLVVMPKGTEALLDSAVYGHTAVQTLPIVQDEEDEHLALIEALIAYLGAETAAEILDLDTADLYPYLQELCHAPGTSSAHEVHADNLMARAMFGIQRARLWQIENDQLSALGKQIYRYAIARRVTPYLELGEALAA